jgi:molybdate transport system substrate-binding protein
MFPVRIAAVLAIATMSAVGQAARAAPPQELVLFEAASLKDAFARLAEKFQAQHAGVEVTANAAGSQELRTQIEHGAKADVFASADRKHMDKLRQGGFVAAPAVFACNQPVLIVRAGSRVKVFKDLPDVERLVVGAPDVPIGTYTDQILAAAAKQLGAEWGKRVQARIVSRELNVRQVMAKVTLGEADAGVVYRTDAMTAAGKVVSIAIPDAFNVTAEYPIAALKAAPRADLAADWIALVMSPAGQATLAQHGFSACPKK